MFQALFRSDKHTLRPNQREMAACGPLVAETCSKPVARRSLRLSTFHPPCASLSITVQHGHGIKHQDSVFAVVSQLIHCFLQSLSSVSTVSTIAIIPTPSHNIIFEHLYQPCAAVIRLEQQSEARLPSSKATQAWLRTSTFCSTRRRLVPSPRYMARTQLIPRRAIHLMYTYSQTHCTILSCPYLLKTAEMAISERRPTTRTYFTTSPFRDLQISRRKASLDYRST